MQKGIEEHMEKKIQENTFFMIDFQRGGSNISESVRKHQKGYREQF